MVKKVEVVSVIRVVTPIGAGTHEDPRRDGLQYYDMDGNLLFVTDADEQVKITYHPIK